MIKFRLSRFKSWLISRSNTYVYILLFLIFGSAFWLLVRLKLMNTKELWNGGVIEFIGTLFDILILGIIFSCLSNRLEKQRDIKRYIEALSDYAGWESDEAMYRNTGNIKRLVRLKKKGLTLDRTCLQKANLSGLSFSSWTFEGAILNGAKMLLRDRDKTVLKNTTFSNCSMDYIFIRDAECEGINLININAKNPTFMNLSMRNSHLEGSNFEKSPIKAEEWPYAEWPNFNQIDWGGSEIHKTNFIESIFTDCKFDRAEMIDINFEGSVFNKISFTNTILRRVNFQNVKGLNIEMFSDVQELVNCKNLGDDIINKLKKEKPEIFCDSWQQAAAAEEESIRKNRNTNS